MNLKELALKIEERFSTDELKDLFFRLSIGFDDLPGTTRKAKIRELVEYCNRHSKLEELISICKELRPIESWPQVEHIKSPRVQIPSTFSEILISKANENQALIIVALFALMCTTLAIRFYILPLFIDDNNGEKTTQVAESEIQDQTPIIPSPLPSFPYTSTPILSEQTETFEEEISLSQSPQITNTTSITPLSTHTPTPLPSPDIIIVEFDGAAEKDIFLARRIEDDLRETLSSSQFKNLRISVQEQPLESIDDAKSLAEDSGSKLVIWGWVDALGVNIRIYFNDRLIGSQNNQNIRTKELPFADPSDHNFELALYVRETVPENVSFISSFILGQLFFENNEYQSGFDTFNAAAANIPEEVVFTNKALLHFFSAREMQLNNHENIAQIACTYAEAIRIDPDLVQAYSNLASLLRDWPVNEDFECDNDIDESFVWDSQYLMNRALELKPESAWLQYNKMVLEWDSRVSSEAIEQLELIIEKDSTIPGAYPMLGTLSRIYGDWETAVNSFEEAVKLFPQSAEFHYNLGQMYLKVGEYSKAEKTLTQALLLNSDDNTHNLYGPPTTTEDEILLALANLAELQGMPEVMIEYLDLITPFDTDGDVNSPRYLAEILRSKYRFTQNESHEAISILSPLVSAEASEDSIIISIDIFTAYLLRSIYILNGEPTLADEVFSQAIDFYCCSLSPPPDFTQMRVNSTSKSAWDDLDLDCAVFNLTGPGEYTLSSLDWRGSSNCTRDTLLSGEPIQREKHIQYIYDTFQDELTNRWLDEPYFIWGTGGG